MKTHEVFGMQPDVRPASYVDRLSLDSALRKLIDRKQQHIAIRGASKCGKSWLRQKNLKNPIIVQCRLDKSALDIYVDALSALGINLEIQETTKKGIKGRISAKGEAALKLVAKVSGEANLEAETTQLVTEKPAGRDVNDLGFIAKLLAESGRTLVIEDFHYLAVDERKKFSFDLKALWDYKVFVIIIGVWTLDNMLLSLNPDLSGRIEELSVAWPSSDLKKILDVGGAHLKIKFSDRFKEVITQISFGSAGILQTLILRSLDELKIEESGILTKDVDDLKAIEAAAMHYAEQLNPLYQEFAKRVSSGIRERKNSTGIYAHAIAAILASSDDELTKGLSVQEIYKRAHKRQPRVQLSNLKAVLQKFEELQVDNGGRGLILAYNPSTETITAVDRQLLLYRKYSTVTWPWEEMIASADATTEGGFGDSEVTPN